MAETLPISGYIDPKAFPFLLIDLHKQGATGSLKVEGGRHQKALYFRAGRVLFGSSNDPRDQLGAILIESGKITEQQFADVNKKVGPGNPLAKALSDSGIVSQRELSEAARAKVERILSDVLSYETGSFEFEDGVLPKGAVDLKLAPERLFLAAVRRVKDRGFVLRHLDGMDVVLSERANFQERLPEIESELGGLAPYLDGQRTLREAASLAAIDDFDAAKIGCGLVFLGLVDKGSTLVIVDSPDEAPFYASGESEGDLGLLPPPEIQAAADETSPTILFSPAEEDSGPTEILEESSHAGAPLADTANDTLVLESAADLSLPELAPPDLAFEAPPEPVPEEEAPIAEPEPLIPQSTVPPPLKIIQPPERSRPPAKPSPADLGAFDDLLSMPSPEGPLHPVEKPVADQWKPQLGPKGGKRAKRSFALDRTLGIWIAVGLLVGAAAAFWMYWTGMLGIGPQRVVTTASPPLAPVPPSTALAAPSTAPSMVPESPAARPSAEHAASASPEPASSPKAPSPTGGATGGQPAPTGSTPAVRTDAGGVAPPPSAPPTRSSAPPAPGASHQPSPAHSSAPGPGKPAPEPARGGAPSGDAKALLRSGQYGDAARAFEAGLRGQKAGYSILILVACKPETIDKAVGSVGGGDLFILPMNYQGKDCYRMVWGVYGSEPAADAGARDLPAYFAKNGARPKVVKVADMLR